MHNDCPCYQLITNMSPSKRKNRPLRILTIDNGGLQAISILRVLMEVCERLAEADGYSGKTPLRPCEVFDIIGGVGTGGWLAILLGRYRLRIDQCMSIYVNIANAIDPTRERLDGISVPGGAVAIDQDTLVGKIDSIIADHGIGQHLVDEDINKTADPDSQECHAFAVGVVRRADQSVDQKYRLFRTYQPSAKAKHEGPDPTKCRISMACAATAAAKDFSGECLLDVDGIKYWDDSFPRTHNVSELALDEADSLFGEDLDLDFVLNISPGIVTAQDVSQLQWTALKNGPPKRRWKVRRIFSAGRLQELAKRPPCGHPRTQSDPGSYGGYRNINRSDTSSSTSSEASQTEREHQKAIAKRLKRYESESRQGRLYFRLELTARGDKPYLDDIAKPDHALQLAESFLQLQATRIIIQKIAADSVTRTESEAHNNLTDACLTTSPGSSVANFGTPSPTRTTVCHG